MASNSITSIENDTCVNNSENGNGNTRNKTPLRVRTQTPSKALLSPNDDSWERAQARAARAAASRRKSSVRRVSYSVEQQTDRPGQVLHKDQILELFQNCIKLASENKINQRNTWDLNLIDHLSEIINVEDGDSETNFQKASCTLEAGVKIYSYRVDSVYFETYKVLAGLNRTGFSNKDVTEENENGENITADKEDEIRREQHKKMPSLGATLESSLDALNVKKFDVAFTVDPLYHQMSAQFDEGGAKGLLLNTLSVYDGCHIVFDSSEVPGRCRKPIPLQNMNPSPVIDTTFMKDISKQATKGILAATEISGTLKRILTLLDDPFHSALHENFCSNEEDEPSISHINDQESRHQPISHRVDNDDYACGTFCEEHDSEYQNIPSFDFICSEVHDCEDAAIEESVDENISSKQTVDFLAMGMSLPSKHNSWAGPEHWKFYKSKEDFHGSLETSNAIKARKQKRRKKHEPFILDYEQCTKIDSSDFKIAQNKHSLILTYSNHAHCNTLPEDCHYEPKELVRLFLIPSIMCVKDRRRSDSSFDQSMPDDHLMWRNGDCLDEFLNECDDPKDDAELNDTELVCKPQKVQKIVVDYDTNSKEVDVRALKETIWHCVQGLSNSFEEGRERDENRVSFKSLVKSIPSKYATSGSKNISVHLCFICLLHLANEHTLKIDGSSDLNELIISNVPTFRNNGT